MADKAILQVTEIKSYEKQSKFEGKGSYWLYNITDGKTGRVASFFASKIGDWGTTWKIGDEVEVEWVAKESYNGKEQWGIKDPNAKPKTGGYGQPGGATGGTTPMLVHAYMIAATSLGAFFKNKEQIKVTDLTALADKILPLIQTAAPVSAPAATVAPAPVAQSQATAPVVVQPAAPAVNTTPSVEGFEEEEDTPF